VQVKASGGIRDLGTARRFVELGATRLGTSSTEALAAAERGESAAASGSY
jgi:deoxyribose-phosphate aldolase